MADQQTTDILILGGGLAGLAIALELQLRGATVTVLSRHHPEAAAYVAAGMLAPQAEKLTGPMQTLCLRSRALYPEWVTQLESDTGLNTGYWPSGILNPVYAADAAFADTASANASGDTPAEWLDAQAIQQQQPGLSQEVIGGWWFPKDGQVDNRRQLIAALRQACHQAGVQWREGVNVEQLEIATGDSAQPRIQAVTTAQGHFRADHYVLATGAWSGQFLNLPVFPRKGQMLSVRVVDCDQRQPLKQVLYGDRIYIVPRRDGLIVLGATVEDVAFTPHNTPQGIHQLLTEAIRLYPQIQDFPIEEMWWGYRPATPDELPILGPSEFANLTLATGYYRNGILLAPITAKLLSDWILAGKTDPLLPHFRWDRFGSMRNTTLSVKQD